MANKLFLNIDGVDLECNTDSSITVKSMPIYRKVFKINKSKMDDPLRLSRQLILVSKRYFENCLSGIDVTFGTEGTDFIDNKVTILIEHNAII